MFSVVSVCLLGVPPYRTPDPPLVQSSSAPRHVHTCSGWTSWYRDPPPPPDMFKLLHNEPRKASKRAVGILLECFLFTIIIEKQECIPVGCVPPAAVAICRGVSASVHAGIHPSPGCGPGDPPPRCGPRDPPQGQTPQFPGCEPGDPPTLARPLKLPP